ncbi:hypothetical protein EJ02DRAFT_366921 [Clathrospora elynae]|uniref:Uncharacterized protein n=1 Tax=Clathrospora elynae TaxID=706981 RepID=A0A6A5T3F7_9PLEO|nr:hypothetical protein EJ02DRAFT_366921 [Clathrospora elynae]
MSLFDKSSGLVYTETTSGRVRSMIPTWATHSRGRRPDPSKHQHRGNGSSTLQSMAIRACIWHVDSMEPEALQWLGWHYASRLYDKLKQTDTLTFNTWSIFAKAYPEQIDRLTHFQIYEGEAWASVPTQLPSIIDRLSKLDVSMITFLCIQNFVLNIDHLIALTKIDTLAALVLEQGNGVLGHMPAVSVRNWGRSVGEGGAFKKLRVLVFGDFGIDRAAVLRGVSHFPVLTLVGVLDSSTIRSQTREACYGEWQYTSPSPSPSPSQEQGPELMWADTQTTKAQKIQLLYDLSNGLAQPPPTIKPDIHRSVSVSLVCKGRAIQDNTVAWFSRDLSKAKSLLAKRPMNGGDLQDEKRHDASNKKRRARDVKKVDVGSLLGTFT